MYSKWNRQENRNLLKIGFNEQTKMMPIKWRIQTICKSCKKNGNPFFSELKMKNKF